MRHGPGGAFGRSLTEQARERHMQQARAAEFLRRQAEARPQAQVAAARAAVSSGESSPRPADGQQTVGAGGAAVIEGVARDVSVEERPHGLYGHHEMVRNVTFRVAVETADGTRLVPVRMRTHLDGAVYDDDHVRASGEFRHGILYAAELVNGTTGMTGDSSSGRSFLEAAVKPMIAAAFVVLLVAIGISGMSSGSDRPACPPAGFAQPEECQAHADR